MDRAVASLNEVLHSGNYVREPGIVLFDAHTEHDAAGNIVRRFDKADLEEICRRCNKRAEETGDLSPFGPGHTIPGAPETMQPPIWGYFAGFRVGQYGPAQKWCILADRYVKKTVDVPLQDGRVVQRDGPQEVATYPRRSIELWAKEKFIDWIAHIRRTPQRDLGLDLLAYDKVTHTVAASTVSPSLYAAPMRQRPLAATYAAGKLRYAMPEEPSDMPLNDPTLPPDANADDFNEKCDRYMRENFKHMPRIHAEHALRYEKEDAERDAANAAAAAAPPPVDTGAAAAPIQNDMGTFPPGEVTNPSEPQRMSRDSDAIRYARVEAENTALKARVAAIEARAAQAEAEQIVTQLEAEGFVLDRAREVLRFSKLDEANRQERATEIRQNYRKDAYGRTPPPPLNFNTPGLPAKPGTAKQYAKEVVDKAVRYAQSKNVPYTDDLLAQAAAGTLS